MNCISAKVKRNKEMLDRKEYQERMSNLTLEQSYELMKQIFEEFSIEYEENVPDDEVGFFALRNRTEERLPDNFLKGFNIENSEANLSLSSLSELTKDYSNPTELLTEDDVTL